MNENTLTESQTIMQEFARRRRRVLIASLTAFVLFLLFYMIVSYLFRATGVGRWLSLLAFAVLGMLVVSLRTVWSSWRCPVCAKGFDIFSVYINPLFVPSHCFVHNARLGCDETP